MPRKRPLSEMQITWLRMIAEAERYFREQNSKLKRGRIYGRKPEGEKARPNPTLMSLYRRNLVTKEEIDGSQDVRLWKITDEGREALRGKV